MKITIERVHNGYIIEYPSDNDESYIIKHVIQDIINENNITTDESLHYICEMLNNVNELVGKPYSKHAKEYIDIKIKKQND